MSCCPEESWGELKHTDYKAKGVVESLGEGLDVYRVGKDGDKCIIWNYDIFGFSSGGRSRMLCDRVAEHGYMVLMPDYYRGSWKNPFDETPPPVADFLAEHTQWEKLQKDIDERVLPYAADHGAKVFGTIGTCWGSYVVVRLGSCPYAERGFKCGVSMHPSHPPIAAILNEIEEDLLTDIVVPQLLMPAGGDAESCKTGGLAEKVLGDKLSIVEFPEMQHGWTTRGDVAANPSVERDVRKAVLLAIQFFDKHVVVGAN